MAFQAKRKFKRSNFREGVRLITPAGLEYATFEDVSAGGLRLFLSHSLQTGTLLDIEFTLRVKNEMRPIEARARVVHCFPTDQGYDIGVAFLDLDSEKQGWLDNLIDSEDGPF